MTKAPKRILVSPDGTNWDANDVTPYKGEVAYVRADIADAMLDAIRSLLSITIDPTLTKHEQREEVKAGRAAIAKMD